MWASSFFWAKALLGRAQQIALGDELHGESLVADRVEEHHHAVTVVALDHALAPVGVGDARAHRERLAALFGKAPALLAVVAVAAGAVVGLADVGKDEGPPAVLVSA
jgi:hypothetical protein